MSRPILFIYFVTNNNINRSLFTYSFHFLYMLFAHHILLDKLEHYGVRGKALQWFKSYLHNSSQYVVYNGLQSAKLGIKCGVPQGSILGPILFLIYINDITYGSRLLQLLLFADDTNIFLEHRDIKALSEIVNSELVRPADWFSENRLSLMCLKLTSLYFVVVKINIIQT